MEERSPPSLPLEPGVVAAGLGVPGTQKKVGVQGRTMVSVWPVGSEVMSAMMGESQARQRCLHGRQSWSHSSEQALPGNLQWGEGHPAGGANSLEQAR